MMEDTYIIKHFPACGHDITIENQQHEIDKLEAQNIKWNEEYNSLFIMKEDYRYKSERLLKETKYLKEEICNICTDNYRHEKKHCKKCEHYKREGEK